MFKREKLYKVVYKTSYGEDRTLLVVARDTVNAIKEFYKLAGSNKVVSIVEFTEIMYKGDGKNDE